MQDTTNQNVSQDINDINNSEKEALGIATDAKTRDEVGELIDYATMRMEIDKLEKNMDSSATIKMKDDTLTIDRSNGTPVYKINGKPTDKETVQKMLIERTDARDILRDIREETRRAIERRRKELRAKEAMSRLNNAKILASDAKDTPGDEDDIVADNLMKKAMADIDQNR